MSDWCQDIQRALAREKIRASVPAVFQCEGDGPAQFDAVVCLPTGFHDDNRMRIAINSLGLDVSSIEHEIYSAFNRTHGGVDEGGGKTWTVRLVDNLGVFREGCDHE